MIQMNFSGDKKLCDRLDIARCIAYHVAGIASDEEMRFLEAWLKESSGHQEEFERIKKQVGAGFPDCPDKGEMWKEFEYRIGRREKNFRKRYYWYAAVLVLPLCLALWLHFRSGVKPVQQVSFTEQKIVPGGTKARLILANGKSIGLGEEMTVKIQEEHGTEILMDGKQVNYRINTDSVVSGQMVYNTLVVPVGGEYSICLADGTQVWLNAGSSLKYPVTFPGKMRQVELEGEGYFEVSPDKNKPFIVRVNGAAVTVLGTSFNISAYNQELVTTLVTGKVSLSKGEEQIVLLPDQQAVWQESCAHFQVRPVQARNYRLWKEGIFWFADATLGTILESLARWYDFQVVYAFPELQELRFSVEMRRYEDVEAALRKIAYTHKVKFNVQEKTVMVTK